MAGTIAGILPEQALIGMVHVGPLPGTPGNSGETAETLASRAVDEAGILADAGFDALIVENMHDAPYVHGDRLGPEIVASMTRIVLEVERVTDLPLGVQILSGGNRHAIAVAQASGAGFVRCENFVFSHVADEGLLSEAEAGPLLRYRKMIGAEGVRVFADIRKKHASHAITADMSIADLAEGAKFFGADGLVITGTATGHPTDPDDVAAAREASGLPVLVGSGVAPENAKSLMKHASGLIVGSWLKHGGYWANPIDPERAHSFVGAVRD